MAVLQNRSVYPMLQSILQKLFKAEYRRLAQVIIDLIKKNEEITGPADGFTYAGNYYAKQGLPRGKRNYKFLDYSLHSEMDRYLKASKDIVEDQRQISQILMRILAHVFSEQEVRDALPECIIDTVPEVTHLKRTMTEAYTIKNDERAWRQYQKILPRIQFYSVTRLMY